MAVRMTNGDNKNMMRYEHDETEEGPANVGTSRLLVLPGFRCRMGV
jgi:hypothetical protein